MELVERTGLVFGLTGLAVLTYLTVLWFAGLGPIGDRPLLLLGILLVMTSFQFVTIGLLGEFIQRQGAGRERHYTIGSTRNLEDGLGAENVAVRRPADAAPVMKDDNRDDRDNDPARHHRAPRREAC